MPSFYAKQWRRLLSSFSPQIRCLVAEMAQAHNQALAEHFYSAMLEDEAAAGLLSHEQVHARLMGSMRQWIAQVLSAQPEDDLEPLVQHQVKIGEIHARVDVPVHLVLRGARRLKDGWHHLLAQHHPEQQTLASQMVAAVIDHAMEAMSQGYAVSRDSNSRTKEAYRLFSVTQNLTTVREQRRAELLAWENQCLYLHALGAESQPLSSLASSNFGLWFRHKGADMFQGAPAAQSILDAIERIDQELLPALMRAKSGEVAQPLLQLHEQVRHMAMNLEALFTQNSELDAGRDVLTQLLNRKFLPVVLSKEVSYARKSAAAFSVLTIDIDFFKQINDQHGHEGGDMVLQQMAVLLSHNIRGGGLPVPPGGRGVPDGAGRYRQRRGPARGREAAQAGGAGALPVAAQPDPGRHHQCGGGDLRRPSRLPAHPAPKRCGAVPRQDRRPQSRAGGRTGRLSPPTQPGACGPGCCAGLRGVQARRFSTSNMSNWPCAWVARKRTARRLPSA